MLKATTIALALGASLALFACGDDQEGCTPVCAGEQIQVCNDDGTLADAADCPEGQMCSEGHDGMEYVHCMAGDDSGMDMGDGSMDNMDSDGE
ncbi:MAG: hypothetical protein HOI23_00380 [Deltaproteobacteria bacterium]|jgi:hypothetical protein|nr:hypothetical protein [Deltaproteobacteria bacterium]MBT6434850.1 hypothetical protein [Deltaproteobacteria bacterium]MBT6492736.1 hypothetical protein [Deltaproteobacteria bacterium]